MIVDLKRRQNRVFPGFWSGQLLRVTGPGFNFKKSNLTTKDYSFHLNTNLISCLTKATFNMRNSTLWKSGILSLILFGFAITFAFRMTIDEKLTFDTVP